METAGWANNERPTYTWRANNKRGKVTRDNAVPLSRADNSRRRHRATLFSRRSPVCVCVCVNASCVGRDWRRGETGTRCVAIDSRGEAIVPIRKRFPVPAISTRKIFSRTIQNVDGDWNLIVRFD